MDGLRIDGDTRLNQVLDDVPGALEYVVGLNPHDFERLRNPLLRKYMAGRISLRRVATMAGVPETTLVTHLRELAGTADAGEAAGAATREAPGMPGAPAPPAEALPAAPRDAPAWMAGVDPGAIRWVDLLPVDAVRGDPFPAVSLGVRQLAPGEVLGIRHRWEPQPLYDIWAKMGLEWYARPVAPDEWQVFVSRPPGATGGAIKPVVGAVVSHLPPAELVPRLVGLAQQLRPGQALEVSGLAPPAVPAVRVAVLEALGPGFSWDPDARERAGSSGPGEPAGRITRSAG